MDLTTPNLNQEFSHFHNRTSGEWERRGQRRALQLFHEAARRVPAYKDFLHQHGVKAKEVVTFEDFSQLPLVDKDGYLRQYPLDQLCWDGAIERANTVSVSSGSTGEPSFWPNDAYLSEIGMWHYELALKHQFQADTKKTLVVVLYTLGTWLAGTHTVEAITALAKKGYPITVTSPGIDKPAALRSIRALGPHYEQVLLIGYPPFVKDIIDLGEIEGINWKQFNIKMMFGGEPFSEPWRDYVLHKVGSNDSLTDTANVYAAADSGMMAIETPTSIALHRLAAAEEELSIRLFGSQRIPTLQQYHPEMRYFQTVGDEIILTANNTIPLIRYNLHDTGGIYTYEEVTSLVGDQRIKQSLQTGGDAAFQCTLPFVYVFGRAHNTATIYALNVYPENIRAATEDVRIRDFVSGKIKLSTEHTETMDQYLHVTMELAHNVVPDAAMKELIKTVTIEHLRLHNSEYNRLVEAIGDRAYPELSLLPQGDATFRPGAKMAAAGGKK